MAVHRALRALARAQDDMSGVRPIGNDETSLRKQEYVTSVHEICSKSG